MMYTITPKVLPSQNPKPYGFKQTVINTVLFQLMWFSTIKLASLDLELLAACPGILIAFFFIISSHTMVNRLTRVAWGIMGLGFGVILEGVLLTLGIFEPLSPPYYIIPMWLLSLWFALFTYLPMELRSLLAAPNKSFLFGFFGAPLSYISGAKLGAMYMKSDTINVILSIGCLWGIVMYFSAHIWSRTQRVKTQ